MFYWLGLWYWYKENNFWTHRHVVILSKHYYKVYKDIIGDGNDCVIKAMVLCGGRGMGHFANGFKGGVHLCTKPGDVAHFASKMLGKFL